MAKKKKMIGNAYKPLELVGRNDDLLTINLLTSKNVSDDYRKGYLNKIKELFTVDEIVKKMKANKSSVYKLFLSNKISIFDGNNNNLERELSLFMNVGNSRREIRNKLTDGINKYGLSRVAKYYEISITELKFYLDLFDIKGSDIINASKSIDNFEELESFSLIDNEDKVEEDMRKYETVYDVDSSSGLIIGSRKIEVPISNTNKISYAKNTVNKTPISIITFLKLSKDERNKKLNDLIYKEDLESDKIEKILGIPSNEYFRKIKSRHLIFDFYNKDKLKTALGRLDNFEDCQKLIYDIIKNKRYDEFKVTESSFLRFADRYFDVYISKTKGLYYDDWDTFYNKIVKHAVNVYKKNTRVTNLTKEEVLDFEKNNRKVITNSDLIAIVRSVVLDIYRDGQSWISIFDFKTEIERNNLELESNEQLIDIVDMLIKRKSFKNENFTLKRITMDNPILSDDSSIRWEFVAINEIPKKTSSDILEPVQSELDNISNKSNWKVMSQPTVVKNVPNNFINNISIDITFDENNINEVIDYLKARFTEIGSGNVSMNITKN